MATKKVKARVEQKDGGYYYPDFEIHVAAKSEKAARDFIKTHHGFDVDDQAQLLVDLAAEAEAATAEADAMIAEEAKLKEK